MFGKKPQKTKKDNKTFKQDGVKLYRCPCGADQVQFVPNGNHNGVRLYSPSCAGCGEVVPGAKHSQKSLRIFKDAWNIYMIARQSQEGGIEDDTSYDEDA